MVKKSFTYPDLYQFFGGYFYQGWPADYRWEDLAPDYRAVVRHFKAVNPPATVTRVGLELRELLSKSPDPTELESILRELGSSFNPQTANLSIVEWLESIAAILDESPTKSRVLRELR